MLQSSKYFLYITCMKNNLIAVKSYSFAIKIVKLCKAIQDNKKEYTLSKQLLKSGTSIGANIEEAIGGQSKKDFYAKLSISYKEARETKFWLRLLTDTQYITPDESKPLLSDCEELLRIIGAIQSTIRKKSINN